MSNSKDKMPKLRFSEFVDSGEWKNDYLGNVSLIVRGGSPRPIDDYITHDKDGLNWLKIGDVNKESKYITETSEMVIKEALTKTRVVNFGDLIMSNSMSFGRPYILRINTCIHDGWIAVTKVNKSIITEYVYYSILSYGSQKYFDNSASGGGIRNLNADIVKMLPMNYPEQKEEQQKIADCLSSLDELIIEEGKKYDLLNEHKKALMQKLFPVKGQTVPELRFPEFIDSGEWFEQSLDDVLIKNSRKNKGLVYLNVQSVSKIHGFINQSEYFEDRKVASNDTSNYYVITKGCFAYNPSRIDVGSLAYKYDDNVSIISPLYVSFKADNKKIDDIFLLNWFFSYGFTKQMIFEGGVRNTLSYENLKAIKILTPPKIEEQQKIAQCLSSLDGLIILQTEKIKNLKLHKKALMQGLFPTNEE